MLRLRYLVPLALTAAAFAAPQPPTALRCEYLSDPIGIDVANPRLYWVPESTDRGATQSAYQVLVSTHPDAQQGDAWDSGKVASGQTVHVIYGGKTLESGRTYYWKVRYWDQKGDPSGYSAVARFETGMLDRSLWKAEWIRGGNVMRKEFDLAAAPLRARAYVTGIGYYELRLNGGKIGNRVLDPGYTPFDKRILYATYDVTSALHAGKNSVGMMLGEGWYHDRAGFLQLEIDLPGGGHVRVATDGS